MVDNRSKSVFRNEDSKDYDNREDTKKIPSTYRVEMPENDTEISVRNAENRSYEKKLPETHRIEEEKPDSSLKKICDEKDSVNPIYELIKKNSNSKIRAKQYTDLKTKPAHNNRKFFPKEQDSATVSTEQDCITKQSFTKKNSFPDGIVPENETSQMPESTQWNITSQETNKKKYSTYQLALELMKEHLFAREGPLLYKYMTDEGYWKLLSESENNRDLRKLIRGEMRNNISKNILYETREWLTTEVPEMADIKDKNKYYLNFKDCALNWHTGKVCVDRKNLYFKYVLQCKYSALSNMPTGAYEKFLQDIFGENTKTRHEFEKFMGLCLSDIRNLKYCIFLYGLSNSGKSVVLNLLKKLVGSEWCSSLSFSQMDSEFAITQLLGKRLNLSGEVSGATNKRLDIFKSLTGNDTVTACFKGKDHFQFQNKSLLVFACNDFPPIQPGETLDSILSRIIIFPFFNVKPRKEWIDNLEDILMEDCAAIIASAIKGLRQLEEDGYRFKESVSMKKCKDEFIGNYNSFAIFASKHIKADVDSTVSSHQIEQAYTKFCRKESLLVLPSNVWPRYLKQKYQCRQRIIESSDETEGKRVRAYQGIQLINIDQNTDKIGKDYE